MAILSMQEIHLYALNKHCKDILEALQRFGAVELRNVSIEDSVFYRTDATSAEISYRRNAATMKNASDVLNSYVKYKKPLLASLQGRIPLTKEEYRTRADNYSDALQKAYDIIRCDKKIAECKAKIVSLESRIEALIPWQALDVPISSFKTLHTTAIIGSFAQKLDLETLLSQIAHEDSDLECFDVEIISSDENQTCIFALCYKRDLERFNTVLRKLGFILPALSSDLSPNEAIKELKSDIEKIKETIIEYRNKIISFKDELSSFNFFEDYFTMKSDCYAQMDNISYSPHTFVMTGYVTKKDGEKIAKYLFENFDAEVELEDVEGEDVPVVLSNNKFTEPVEGVVLSYSPPHRKEIDPTGIMALFYYIFFGMMFSDAGYGLVMSAGCALGLKLFPNMEKGLRRSLKMFFWCGVSTLFWGLMFGSFFGDAVKVISNTFFNVDAPSIPGITTPIWFNPTEGSGPTTLLMFSFLLGIIHLFAGLTMQAVNYIRHKKIFYAIFDDLSWMMLVGGAVLVLLSTEMLASMAGFMLPSVWMTIGAVMALVGAVLILFCSARSKNPLKRFVKGAYNLYGVTGYLSDILSYSRLLALGLATGVVAQVFNQLGAMFGSGVVGVIGFTIVFIIGHILNIGINALGAYVHTNRLQFVEFFGKFYEGGGKEFKPYAVNTKYYNVKEDI
ncbi:MAG: V-type ATP synthase subunit I [Ruminococcaceae bacterium]|nr:V-type ATP synthase subunit I [Oscillospiraceae bacterium]